MMTTDKRIPCRLLALFLAALLAAGSSPGVLSAQTGEPGKTPEPVFTGNNLDPDLGKKEPFRPRFMLGVTGGANLSNVLFQPNLQEELKLGYDAGIVLRYDVVSYAGIWLEAVYSSRGWAEVSDNFPGYRYERTINFIHLPVMTHFMIGQGPFKVTVDAGAHFGYYLGESSAMTPPDDPEGGMPFTGHHETAVQKPFFWGVGGGVGAEYSFGRRLIAGLRGSYVYGFGDLFNNTRSDTFVKSSEQIISAKLYLLYAF